MTNFCLLIFMASSFMIVPTQSGKDPQKVYSKDKLKEAVKLFEPKNAVPLTNLKTIVKGALGKLPEEMREGIAKHSFFTQLLKDYKQAKKRTPHGAKIIQDTKV